MSKRAIAQRLRADDERLTWQGIVTLQQRDDWVMPWRLPYAERALFPPDELRRHAAMPAGVRIAFVSDTDHVAGMIVPDPDAARLDLCCNGVMHASVALAGEERFVFPALPPGEKLIELWLPQFGTFRLRSLEIASGASLSPFVDPRPRWVTYGSSITQCHDVASPTQAWPAIVARQYGFNLTCLGFAAQCHLDPMIARMIRDLPADFLSICVGINVYGAASLSSRTLGPAIIGFIHTIRDGHPDLPFAVLSPIYARQWETAANAVGLTLRAIREEVRAVVALLRAAGDANLYSIDGLTLLGEEAAHLMPDGLHPNSAGYRLMGQRFGTEVAARLFA